MLVCKECGATFNDEEANSYRECVGDFWGAPAYQDFATCPSCGCDDITEAVYCDICGEYFDPDEMYRTENYCVCKECKEALITAFKAYRDYVSEHPRETINPFEMLSTSAEREIIESLKADGVLE